MTPSEIITADAQQHGVDPAKVLKFVAYNISAGKANLIQAHDTVLLLTHLTERAAECHLFTADSPRTILEALKHFLDVVRQSPIKRLYGEADNEGIIRMLEMIGLQIKQPDRPGYNWMAEV